MAADESTTQDTHETAEGSTTPVEATEEETAAEVAESPAGEAAEATAAPDVRFDPTNPFAVPEGLLPLIEAETVERRRRRPAADPVPEGAADDAHADDEDDEDRPAVSRRRRRRRRGTVDMELAGGEDGDPEDTVTRVRAPRRALSTGPEAVQGVKGSTRLEAKRQRRRESRSGGRRRTVITEAEFLARRESVDRKMLVRQREHRIQIAVLEDGVLAEHFVSNTTQDSMIGNVYLGKVQNVLPSMEAAFVDIGRGRNAVLYAGEVDWDAAQLDGKAKKIENALKSGDTVLVQVTKDPVGHKGARLTSQISLPGRYLVYVPGGTMTGISRKLPDVERARLKKILKDHLPQDAGVIVRTAAEGTSEQELQNDINRLRVQWEGIQEKASSTKTLAPELLYAEPDLTIKTVRDVFNEDFSAMLVQGEATWDSIEAYVTYVAPHLLDRLHHWVPEDHDGEDLYATHRVDEQLHKALERKVYLPSGGSLVIDRTEAMTVVDVNTGKFTGSGGNLEETVTKNNLEAAEEVVRQLRLRDIGGIIVIDFIDMVLESNQDLVLRRLVECLGRDRTKHQVAEVTSLGLVQMTRKRMGTGLVEVFSEVCEHCGGRGILIQDTPVERNRWGHEHRAEPEARRRNKRRRGTESGEGGPAEPTAAELTEEERLRAERAAAARTALMSIAKASGKAADEEPSEEAAPRAEDAPEEAADEVRPSPAGDAEEQGESESGGRRRKRRGRRRGRGRGGDDAARSAEEQDAPAEHPAEAAGEPAPAEAGAPDPAETATEDADADSASDAPAAQAEADEDGRSGGRRRSRRRGGRRAESPQGSGAPASAPEASVEAEQDPEEPAGAAEAEEALAAEEAPASPEPAAVVTFDGEPVAVPRRRRSRRATSDGVSAPRPSGMDALEAAVDRRAEDAAAAAQRSPATPAATPTAAPEPAPAPVAGEGPAAAAPRRRSRRAVSADGATVQVQEGAAAGGGRFTAQAAQAAPAGETAAPVMLGVGVKAADIVRGE
ncbi:Rne/Rng family ribonuclease [Micrococcus porci]|uniref:Rne/Rng family ribonuclease n=1 Tax=Micrococcus porci TaxID=2856555 RepID=UPI001CCE134D|nr:Rne/Rng family ribonuclease [Micrococcus porci]UBH24048.1 Rne/Rng family ribonuclease [Micrococcus porci]